MERNSSFFWGFSERSSSGASMSTEQGLGLSIDVEDSPQPFNPSAISSAGNSETNGDIDENSPLVIPPLNQPLRRHILPHEVNVTANTKKKGPYTFNRGSSNTIRFQVVVWYVGNVDVVQSTAQMRFRVTIFWNDMNESNNQLQESMRTSPSSVWTMKGRMKACQEEDSYDRSIKTIDVPPISILNAVQFETIGPPEITVVKTETKLMRWTCMYSATLFQGNNMRVEKFPHDQHDVVLKLGILAHRRAGARWDKRKWTLGLATEQDSQGSTRIPHGLLVDHVSIPDFKIDETGLKFEFVPMPMGSGDKTIDCCLQVKLAVVRESRHYDKNIMPLLVMLNIVAVTCLVRNFASATASTETMLSIAFVEIGIRLTVDNRLPSVGYQIKIQSVLNQCFFLLCCLVLETNFVFYLVKKRGWSVATTDWIDFGVALLALSYTWHIWTFYYWDWKLIPILDF